MRNTILLAAGAALALAAPAFAKPGHGNGNGNGHGPGGHAFGGGCPPGLAKKGNGCLPPGQAKKLYGIGDRVPRDQYGAYSAIPSRYRSLVPYSDAYRYIYRDNTAYVVDRRTNMVTRIIDLLAR
jgi:hypothetical protein